MRWYGDLPLEYASDRAGGFYFLMSIGRGAINVPETLRAAPEPMPCASFVNVLKKSKKSNSQKSERFVCCEQGSSRHVPTPSREVGNAGTTGT